MMQEQAKEKRNPAPTTAQSSRPASGEKVVRTLHEMMLIDPTLIQYEKG